MRWHQKILMFKMKIKGQGRLNIVRCFFFYKINLIFSVEVYNMQSRIWRAIANLKSNVLFPNFHVYKEKLTMFGSDNSIQIYNGETWEFASESLQNTFYRGVSVKVPCHWTSWFLHTNFHYLLFCFKKEHINFVGGLEYHQAWSK